MAGAMTYRSTLSILLISASCLAFAFIGAAMALSTDAAGVDIGGRVLGLVLVCLFGSLMLRAIRSGLRLGQDGVVVRSLFRTRRLPWGEIANFAVGGSWSIVPWQTVSIERCDGTILNAPELGSLPLRRPTAVERAVEALNERLADSRHSPTTPP